jgi:catechol 2,3-dioxygenase-like lactoylglutathione lyase family enzyme
MALQLDTVFVWVTDLERSLPWYRALGIEPGPRHGPWQEMDVSGDTRFALHQGGRAPGVSTAVPSLRVTDLDSEIERLATKGIRPTDDEVTDTGAARFITFTDPDGNEVQLLERR